MDIVPITPAQGLSLAVDLAVSFWSHTLLCACSFGENSSPAPPVCFFPLALTTPYTVIRTIAHELATNASTLSNFMKVDLALPYYN
ncbi:unnamed protein product [Somion occarium]|uniref:Uncharacterized protein n=1 Tax=Somion occarium TaxID=3059160 RepID=A0ABP1DIU2_9APHY